MRGLCGAGSSLKREVYQPFQSQGQRDGMRSRLGVVLGLTTL